jgi:hypothetical protein
VEGVFAPPFFSPTPSPLPPPPPRSPAPPLPPRSPKFVGEDADGLVALKRGVVPSIFSGSVCEVNKNSSANDNLRILTLFFLEQGVYVKCWECICTRVCMCMCVCGGAGEGGHTSFLSTQCRLVEYRKLSFHKNLLFTWEFIIYLPTQCGLSKVSLRSCKLPTGKKWTNQEKNGQTRIIALSTNRVI